MLLMFEYLLNKNVLFSEFTNVSLIIFFFLYFLKHQTNFFFSTHEKQIMLYLMSVIAIQFLLLAFHFLLVFL